MSVQLARLKYAQKMRNVTSAARDSIVGREHLLPYVKELERRVATVLSPKPQDVWDAVAGVANRVTYLWTLTSASTALIQPISIYVSALPILAANHGFSPIRTAKELGKMITYLNQYGIVKENVDGTHRYVAPSIANAKIYLEGVNKRMSKGMKVVSPAVRVLKFDASAAEFLQMDAFVAKDENRDGDVSD